MREISPYITEKSNIKQYFSIKRKGDHYHEEVVGLELPLKVRLMSRGGEGERGERARKIQEGRKRGVGL